MSSEAFAETFSSESRHVELKEGVSRQKIREAVVAFSNDDGVW